MVYCDHRQYIIRVMTITVNEWIALNEAALTFRYIRASGPGGQNVNKVASAVQLRFDVEASPALPGWVKARLKTLAGSRLTKAGVIVIEADRHRTQALNRDDAVARLVALIQKAAERKAFRVKTKPSQGAKKRRLESKKKRGDTKKLRGRVDY